MSDHLPKKGEHVKNAKKFSSSYQPSTKSKKDGKLKKKRAAELVKAILDQPYKGKADSQMKEEAARYFGIPVKEITNEVMMIFRQLEKAIAKYDTNAFYAIMNRAFGQPPAKTEVTGQDGGPIATTTENIDYSMLSDEVLRAIKNARAKRN